MTPNEAFHDTVHRVLEMITRRERKARPAELIDPVELKESIRKMRPRQNKRIGGQGTR